MYRRLVGILLLIAVIVVAIGYKMSKTAETQLDLTKSKPKQVSLTGLLGSGKIGLLDDEDIKKIFKDKYGLTVNYTKAGSLEMSALDTSKFDFIFPSSQVAFESYKKSQGNKIVKSQTIFYTPLVLYSWDVVTDALIKNGIVQKIGENYYITGFAKLIEYINSGKKWSDVGITDLYGKITIYSTDPTKSSSGIMYAGLLASVMNGDLVDANTVDKTLPNLKNIFKNVGYMESSSSDIFDQYLRTGVGAKPIIVAYENQIVEFSLQNAEVWKQVKDKIRILYPVPTMWSPHTFIALNQNALVFLNALQDKDVQKIAWERHGFRTGIIGVENDPKILNVVGIPKSIDSVMPSPESDALNKIIETLQN